MCGRSSLSREFRGLDSLSKTLKISWALLFVPEKHDPVIAKTCNEKIDQIEQKIADLNRMVAMLHEFSLICGSKASNDSECRLLDCFENNWECCEK